MSLSGAPAVQGRLSLKEDTLVNAEVFNFDEFCYTSKLGCTSVGIAARIAGTTYREL